MAFAKKTKKKDTKKKESKISTKKKKKSASVIRRGESSKIQSGKKYSPEALKNALEAVMQGVSLRKAAATHGVSYVTLFRRKKGEVRLPHGPATILTKQEENDIVYWIVNSAEKGCPITKSQLLDTIQKYVLDSKKVTPFIDGRPGRHWYESFRKRHPNLSLRTVQHLPLDRVNVTEEDLRGWFSEIKVYLINKNLLHVAPSRQFNCDETSIKLCPNSEKVLTKKGSRSVYKITQNNEKENMTVLFMYNAEGARAPPMLMYAYQEKVPNRMVENVSKGWGIGVSESGWMTAETFYEYITNVFYPWLVEQGVEFPVILYLDNHSSHITLPLVTFCRNKSIELIGLYPHSTHITQPLDIAFFHPFKDVWRKKVLQWKSQHNVMTLRREQFPIVLQLTLDSMDERKIITNGFRAAGLVPFHDNALNYDVCNKKSKAELNQSKNLQNVPVENYSSHLITFETNLSKSVLQQFQNCELSKIWTGKEDLKGLFQYWLSIKYGISENNAQVIPIIKDIDVIQTNPIIEDIISQAKPTVKSIELTNLDLSRFKKIVNTNLENPNLLENVVFLEDPITELSTQTYSHEISTLQLSDTILSNEILNFEVVQDLSATSIQDSDISYELPSKVIIEAVSESISDRINNNEAEPPNNEQTSFENTNLDSAQVILDTTKENSNINANESFANTFVLPTKYLPKKKKSKLQSSGKTKLPSAGTSDEWYKYHVEKEKEQVRKEDAAARKKALQNEKKS